MPTIARSPIHRSVRPRPLQERHRFVPVNERKDGGFCGTGSFHGAVLQ